MKCFHLCVLLWVGCVYSQAAAQRPDVWFADTPVADLVIHHVFRTRVLFNVQGEKVVVRLGDTLGREKLTLKHAHPKRVVLEGPRQIVVFSLDEQNRWQMTQYETPTTQPSRDQP